MAPRAPTTRAALVRALVGVAALCLVLRGVHWHDWATLADGETRVRVLDWRAVKDDPRFEDPARRATIPLAIAGVPGEIHVRDLATTDDGGPRIEIGLASAYRSSDPGWLAATMLLFAPLGLMQSLRFRWLVRAQGIPLSYWEAVKLSYAGNFLNFVALGSTGGDVFKAYYVSRHTHLKTEAVATVVLDRVVGLVSLVLVAAAALLMPADDPRIGRWAPVVVLLAAIVVAGGLLAFSRRSREVLGVRGLLAALPFSTQLARVDGALLRMRAHPGVLGAALGLTLLAHVLAIAAFVVAAIGLGMGRDPRLFPGYFLYLTLALLVAAVPISYQGLGTMDAALQLFLGGTYGTYSQILFLGLAMRLLPLIWSLPGFLVTVTASHRPRPEELADLDAPGSAPPERPGA
jgi:hypothetical protein